MARPLRIEYPGAIYHVTSRGNARSMIFDDDEDRGRFLDILTTVVKRHRWLCHAYCLMGNHYHLLIETPEANLAREGSRGQVLPRHFFEVDLTEIQGGGDPWLVRYASNIPVPFTSFCVFAPLRYS